ncbi:MAG: glycosyltransferase family 4 protein, partial [Candidatus Bathyarchaeota archaeon]
EGWGIAIAEAMACGLPVVVYELPIYKEIFNSKLVTVTPGDVDGMSKQVLFLLQNHEVSRKIGEDGKRFVERYDWQKIADEEMKLILSMNKNRKCTRTCRTEPYVGRITGS